MSEDHIRKIARLLTEDPDILSEIALPDNMEDGPRELTTDTPGLESHLIDDPDQAMIMAKQHPDHGNFESGNKIYSMYVYGTDYKRTWNKYPVMQELQLLKKYWNIDPRRVFQLMKDAGYELEPQGWDQIRELIQKLL